MYSVSPAPRRGERRARDAAHATHTHTRLCAQGVIRLLGNASFSVVSNQDYDGNLVQHTIACRCQNSAHRQHTGTGWAMNRNDRLSGRRQLIMAPGWATYRRLPSPAQISTFQRHCCEHCIASVSSPYHPIPKPHPPTHSPTPPHCHVRLTRRIITAAARVLLGAVAPLECGKR